MVGKSGAQPITWDVEGHVATEDTTTSFIYDADGGRLIRRDPAGKALYLPGQELRYTSTSKKSTRYYSHGGGTVAMRTTGGVTWLSGDHQGTASVSIPAVGQAFSLRRQDPYGNSRTGSGTWPSTMDKRFVGGTKDATGLTHLGAREYDPLVGQFVSVDSMFIADDPQQFNGYQYGAHNPVSKSDPDGTCVFDEETRRCDHKAEAELKKLNNEPRKPLNCPLDPECRVGKGGGPFTQPPWVEHAYFVKYTAQKYGVDPSLLLGNLIIEGWQCFAMQLSCGDVQRFQVSLPDWAPKGQGNLASVGVGNMDRATFEETKSRHAELNGYVWSDMIDNSSLSITAMALRFKDLDAMLPSDLSASKYSRTELLRFGYQNTPENVLAAATGTPFLPENEHLNKRFHVVYDLAARYYRGDYPGEPRSDCSCSPFDSSEGMRLA